MDRLTSCYFCGAALDASLDEYPVVPKDLHPDPDEQRSVVLCQGCRRKLGTVIEAVLAAVEGEPGALGADGADGVEANGAPGTDGADEIGDGDATDDGEGGDEWDRLIADDEPAENGAEATTDGAPGVDDADGAHHDEAAGDEADGEVDSGSTTEPAAVADDDAPEGTSDDDGTGGDGRAGDEAVEDAAGEDDDRPTMTALENTRVMRLLQNREFPVDRAEIRVVAVNAYDISESRFDAVVDAAVDRGLIGEEKGQIVEAE